MRPIGTEAGIRVPFQNSDSPPAGRTSVDARLSAALNRTLAASDSKGIQERRQQLRTLFNSLAPTDARALYDKLQSGDNHLSRLFAGKLHHATRNELLGILHNKLAPASTAQDASNVGKKVVEGVRGHQHTAIQEPVSIHQEKPGTFLIDFGRSMDRGDVNKALFPDGKVPPGVVIKESAGEWRLQFVMPGSDLKMETLRQFRPEITSRLLQAPGVTAKELSTQGMMEQLQDMQKDMEKKLLLKAIQEVR